MKIFRVVLLLTALATTGLASAGEDLHAVKAGPFTYTIFLSDDCDGAALCFRPNPMTIHVGDSVLFIIDCHYSCGGKPHNVVADDGSFRCGLGCDGEGGDGSPNHPLWYFTRTFNTAGVVKYHDEVSLVGGVIFVSPGPVGPVIEFYNPDLDHYFITADPAEQANVDMGTFGRWQRTGNTFNAGGPTAVCRFHGNTYRNGWNGLPLGPNSHFFTADAYECASLEKIQNYYARSWLFESHDFTTTVPGNEGCAMNLMPVYRAYNRGYERGIDPNHRITSSVQSYEAMSAAGWIGEGVVMCAPR